MYGVGNIQGHVSDVLNVGKRGLGKPSIKLEFEDNESLVDFQRRMADNTQKESEPMSWNKEKGEFEPLEGIRVVDKKNITEYLTSNPAAYIPPEDFNETSFKNVLTVHNTTGKRRTYIVETPLARPYNWIVLRDYQLEDKLQGKNSNGQDRTKFKALIKPTLENPRMAILDSKGLIFVKPFINYDGKPILFCAVLVFDIYNYVSSCHPKKLKDIIKKANSGNVLYPKNWEESRTAPSPNATVRTNKPFEVVEICLPFSDKDILNISDNQIFNEKNSLAAPGDAYIITDTRTKARKDLQDMATLRKYDVRPLTGKELQKMQDDDPLLYEQIKSDLGKSAADYNVPESALDCRGYHPTYRRLADYSHLVDAANGAKTLKGYGFDRSTLDELLNACKQYKQVERLAAHLKDDDKMQSAFNIWHWLHTNIKYNYDTPGEEEIRTPARTWADRERGVDCDCLAVFTACLLLNMGYKPRFEIVAFNDSSKFSHIYVNLDGAAIDRVLPVFLKRPDGITNTLIMDIPVYELSGVGLCDTLEGVYSSTLAKIENGTATGNDINDFRKTQVLITLKGLDEAAYQLAALLMPHVATIGDDGAYYFDCKEIAALATLFDAQYNALKVQGASDEMVEAWLRAAVSELEKVEHGDTTAGEDTIVVIINPKGGLCRVCGRMVASNMQTLPAMSQTATATATTTETATTQPGLTTTTTTQTASASTAAQEEKENKGSGIWLLLAGLGVAAMAAMSSKKRRQ